MNKMDLKKLVTKNQSIKIVPSVEESLRKIGLNVDLDDNVKLWFDQLIVTWKTWKKSATLENHIEVFFYSVKDPHRIALVFAVKCDEFKDCKPKSLPYFIIETLQKWSHTNGVFPEDSLKYPAFQIAIQQRNQHFLSLMVKTFQISTIKENILPVVRNMIKTDNCRQASQIVIVMELFDEVPVEDLLFPLILQDKLNMVDEYLSQSPSQVKPFLLFLDTLLDKNVSIREFVQKYLLEIHVYQIKYEKLHYKPLGKLVARLCNKFNVPIETCKNLSKNRTTGGLRYLIHQRYQEHNVSSTVWDDLVKDSLRQNAGSAQEFIDMLVDYDRKEALKWAEYLKIPLNDLPLALRDLSLRNEPTNAEEENWDKPAYSSQSQTNYKISLSDDQIVMIDTAEKFCNLMTSNIVHSNIVSIDCEWKPSFGAKQSLVALLQIATNNKVYLIDCMVLNKPEYSSYWYTFQKSLLDNAEMIKLGFGLEQDLKEIKASITGLANIKVKGEGLLDLCLLWKNLMDCGLNLPGVSETGGNSLSSLVQSCFGLPLEKSEQCSNWELRPLRKTQIQYAALDAHILIEIYEFLLKLCNEQGIHFEEICNDVMLEGKKKCSKKTKAVERVQPGEGNQSKSVDAIKLLVEPELSNLMCYLRYCGIDTVVISTTTLWHDEIYLAISEDRFIISPKLKFTSTVNFPQTSILDVGIGSVREQLQKIINNYNINIKQTDLLSRCLHCNCKDLKKLNPDQVLSICNEYQNSTNVCNYKRYGSDDEDDNLNNFLSDSECDEDMYVQPVAVVYHKKTCTTSKGALIDICNVNELSKSHKPAILCESCGKLYWDEDDLFKSVVDLVFEITELKLL